MIDDDTDQQQQEQHLSSSSSSPSNTTSSLGNKEESSLEDELDWGTLCSPNGLEHELMTYAPLKKLLNTIIKKVSSQEKKLSSVDDKVTDAAKQASNANENANKLQSLIDASEQEKMGEKETNGMSAKTETEKQEKRHNDLLDKIGDLEKQLQDMKKQNEDLKQKNLETEDKLKRLVGDALKTMQATMIQNQQNQQPTTSNQGNDGNNNPVSLSTSDNSTARKIQTPEENKRNIQDVEVFSTPEAEKTVQLYKPSDDEDNSTLQSVILSLPKHGKVTQFVPEEEKENQNSTNETTKPKSRPSSSSASKRNSETPSAERPQTPPQKLIKFAPAAVTDENHRINFSADSQTTEGVVDPFKYNVYDVKNDLDRAQVSRVKGVLLSQLNELQRELEDAKKKEKDDVALLLDQMLEIRNQVNSIDKKLDLAQKLKGQEQKTPTDNLYEEGLLDVQMDAGKNVKVFIPPKTDELDSSVTDSINELLGKIDYLEGRLLEATSRIEDLENRPQPQPVLFKEENITREAKDGSSNRDRTETPTDRPESSNNSEDTVTNTDLKKLEKKLMYYITTHDMSSDLNNQLQDVVKQLEGLEDRLNQKCDISTTPNHQQFKDIEGLVLKKADREEVHNMIDKLKNDSDKQPVVVQRPFSPQQQEDRNSKAIESSGIDQADLKKFKEALNNLSAQLSQLSKMKADKIDVFKELSEKKEQIDRLDQTKSDANIVARKAEREYVDSLFNKLKKDLENSISMTNTHTADLLAKDLEFLKRLIEDKADTDEIRRIKEYLNQAFDTKTTTEKDGDGLASSQAFKCLSCNRALKGMKMKPKSLNFDNFISHLPPPKQKVNPKKQFLNDSLTKSSVQIPSSILDDQGKKNRSSITTEHLPELRKSTNL